jgi:hypothetical protein
MISRTFTQRDIWEWIVNVQHMSKLTLSRHEVVQDLILPLTVPGAT